MIALTAILAGAFLFSRPSCSLSTPEVTPFSSPPSEYRLDDSAAVVVNHDLHRIRFQGATLETKGTPTETITVTGYIPYRMEDLPRGC